MPCGQLGGDVVLVSEPAEDLLPLDPELGEVDLFGRAGACLGWCELAEGAVRPGGVVVPQVLGQHLVQVVLVDDRSRSRSSRRRVPMILSQIALDDAVDCTRSR